MSDKTTKAKSGGMSGKRTALDSYATLVRAAETMTARINRQLDTVGLTVSQFGVLDALHQLGPLSQSDLARKILKTSGNLTMVIDNLERQALVRRDRDSADRRVSMVSLTEKGRRTIAQLFPKHANLVARQMSILKPSEQQTLARLCHRLGVQARA